LDRIEYTLLESSLGTIVIVARGGRIIRLDVRRESPLELRKIVTSLYRGATESPKTFRRACLLMDRYLKGERVVFDLEVDLSALPEFTRRVLVETAGIPYGEVRSYLWISRRLGYGNAARAVGQALKRNPVPIIIPCHRVIREDGTIGGFSLEGVTKERLLSLEKVPDRGRM
jgi:methylated-DNA-[protein]-cysteine S-methyltransferase